jgi:hypothetical protein
MIRRRKKKLQALVLFPIQTFTMATYIVHPLPTFTTPHQKPTFYTKLWGPMWNFIGPHNKIPSFIIGGVMFHVDCLQQMQFPIARGFKACQWKCSNELRKNIARFSFFIFENTSLHARSFHELKGPST